MRGGETHPTTGVHLPGFVLAATLMVVGGLLILAVGVLLVAGIERSTARSFVDRKRADLAARAGLEDVGALLRRETANDDFWVVQSVDAQTDSPKDPATYLYLMRATEDAGFRSIPLFSTAENSDETPTTATLTPPIASELTGEGPLEMKTLPWCDDVRIAWIPLTDASGKIVSRCAYWVEDLQGKLPAMVAGNTEGPEGIHARSAFPAPSAKPLTAELPALHAVALHSLDPASGDASVGDLTTRIHDGRSAMISPESILGAAGFSAPQPRDAHTGRLVDPLAAALEIHVTPTVQPYREQPVVPYAAGIGAAAAGKPKLNLNELLGKPRPAAVDEFASWIRTALPAFETRKGGFPDDYLKTLAANALDYADADGDPTITAGSHRGLDSFPLLSELAVKLEYLGPRGADGRLLLRWRIKVFGEFWNMTSQPVSGRARLSYEVALNHSPIGSGTAGRNFDDPTLLDDPEKSHHNLTRIDGRFYGPEIPVTLAPDEYRFFQFCEVECDIDVAPNNVNYNTVFYLEENLGASGVSVRWNGVETERMAGIVRDPGPVSAKDMRFNILHPKATGKAAIPGGSYGPYGDFTNNMGDPRMSHYFREIPVAENSWKNLSPNRRNVRLSSIYQDDGPEKRAHYGRVLPSEWPDGGHNAAVGGFPLPPARQALAQDVAVEPTDPTFRNAPPTVAGHASMRISNEGRFHSVTELGNIYDPVMWLPAYADLPDAPGSGARDSAALRGLPPGKATMPTARNAWPDVTRASTPSTNYGGGNSLRIGRPEHPRFDVPGTHAAHFLDLFFAGNPDEPDSLIHGHINVNTAGKDVLRAMAAGLLAQDPELRTVTSWAHETATGTLAPTTAKLALGTPTRERAADRIAEAIIRSRPFASMKDLACARDEHGDPAFGSKSMYPDGAQIQWSDAAAEEVFARVHDAATLRSRNFRVWVIGQSVTMVGPKVTILAESRRAFTVFADPGPRRADGSIDPANTRLQVLYENDF